MTDPTELTLTLALALALALALHPRPYGPTSPPPQVARGAWHDPFAADAWSLGVCLLALLAPREHDEYDYHRTPFYPWLEACELTLALAQALTLALALALTLTARPVAKRGALMAPSSSHVVPAKRPAGAPRAGGGARHRGAQRSKSRSTVEAEEAAMWDAVKS